MDDDDDYDDDDVDDDGDDGTISKLAGYNLKPSFRSSESTWGIFCLATLPTNQSFVLALRMSRSVATFGN